MSKAEWHEPNGSATLIGARGDFRFAGAKGYVNDDATGWQMLGARLYVPAVGRFLTQDPVGQYRVGGIVVRTRGEKRDRVASRHSEGTSGEAAFVALASVKQREEKAGPKPRPKGMKTKRKK